MAAEGYGYGGRARFVGSEPVCVGSAGDGCLGKTVMFPYRHHYVDEKSDELEFFGFGLSRREKIHAGIGSQRPVVVLAAAVDSLKRFLMKKHSERVSASHFFHHGPQKHVVVI